MHGSDFGFVLRCGAIWVFSAICTRSEANTARRALEGEEPVFVAAARGFYDYSWGRRIEARAVHG